jgi:hypothetical protein
MASSPHGVVVSSLTCRCHSGPGRSRLAVRCANAAWSSTDRPTDPSQRARTACQLAPVCHIQVAAVIAVELLT